MTNEASFLGLHTDESLALFWRGLFDIHVDALAVLSADYRIVRANHALAAAMGCRPEQLVGRYCYEVFHGGTCPIETCPHTRLLSDGCAHAGEHFVAALGGMHWISVTPVFDTEGALVGSLHIARDVSRYKRLEDDLREARDAIAARADAQALELKQHVRFEQLLVSFALESGRARSEPDLRRLVLDGVTEIATAGGYERCVFWRVQGGVARVVASFEEQASQPPPLGPLPSAEEVAGWLSRTERMGFVDRVGNCERCVAMLPPLQSPGGQAFVLQVEYLPTAERSIRVPVTPERLRLFCDVFGTAMWRHASRMEMQSMRDEMDRLDRVSRMGQLTAMLTHEVNQPLAATLCNAQAAVKLLALSPPDVEEARSALDDIIDNARRAGSVIQRTRMLFKGERAPLRRVAIPALVERAISLLHNEFVLVEVAVDASAPSSLPPVWGDEVQLQQVLTNLLTNAIDAVRSKPREERSISVRALASESSESVVLIVQDSGVGIAVGQEERIFQPFHTTKAEGMGMGLAICKQVVESFGGTIAAERLPGGGTLFRVTMQAGAMAPKV